MTQLVERYYRLLVCVSSSIQSPFLLAVRLYWGWQFMQTGWGKLNDVGKVMQFFTTLGIPAPALNAYFVSALEFGGGLLLILGGGSRGAFFHQFQSRQIHGRGAVRLPDHLSNRAYLRSRPNVGGRSFGGTSAWHSSPAGGRGSTAGSCSELKAQCHEKLRLGRNSTPCDCE